MRQRERFLGWQSQAMSVVALVHAPQAACQGNVIHESPTLCADLSCCPYLGRELMEAAMAALQHAGDAPLLCGVARKLLQAGAPRVAADLQPLAVGEAANPQPQLSVFSGVTLVLHCHLASMHVH